MKVKVRTSPPIESKRLYSTREILQGNYIYWVRSYKTLLRYMNNRKFVKILKPKVKGATSGRRYFVQGSNLNDFIQRFENSEFKGRLVNKTTRTRVLTRKEEAPLNKRSKGWYNLKQVCNEKMLPGISTYHTFRRHLKAGKLKGLKVRIVSSVDEGPLANRYWIKGSDLQNYLKSKQSRN